MNGEDMALEQNYSLEVAANHAILFTDLAIQRFAWQLDNSNVTFTHAIPDGFKTPITQNLPFWARIPMKCAMTVGLGVTTDDCA